MALKTWLSATSMRWYPRSETKVYRGLELDAALNEQISLQACVCLREASPRKIRVDATGPEGWTVRVRRVGYVPVRHLNTALAQGPLEVEGEDFLPGFAPDPLLDENECLLAPDETHAFWVTIRPAADARPGLHRIRVGITPEEGKERVLQAGVRLHDIRLAPRSDFRITHWFYADAISDWYGVKPFSEAFWPVCGAYIDNYAGHGLDTLYVPVFTPPLDGVKRPTQLLRVDEDGNGGYVFDWTDVKRWIDLARSCGITHFEWTHPFTQWGVKHAIRIYAGQGHDEQLLWPPDTPALSPVYRRFLAAFLPELRAFLERENIMDASMFHVSDEPHSEADKANYIAARNLLKELAPWMKTMDALTDIDYGRQGLTDIPVPSISRAVQFFREGIESWCYYCCGPRGAYLNRLMDTPLAKIAMHGFLFYRWPFKGFLHWGYNYWYRSQTRTLIDPFCVQDAEAWPGWASGDPFVVYPGPKGPIDSLRWEVFAEALQDYRLLQTLDLPRDHALLRGLRDFDSFPKRADWRRRTRKALFAMADG